MDQLFVAALACYNLNIPDYQSVNSTIYIFRMFNIGEYSLYGKLVSLNYSPAIFFLFQSIIKLELNLKIWDLLTCSFGALRFITWYHVSFRMQRNNSASKWMLMEELLGNQLKMTWGHWLLMTFWEETGCFNRVLYRKLYSNRKAV